MATQMIAKALMMKVLGIFMPGAGAGFNVGSALVGGGGGAGLLGMAQGAYVNSATPALVGEGGTPEYVIPENKMSSTMARWSMGMRGKGVVEGADSSFGSQNRSGNQPTALGDVSKRYNPGNNYSSTNNYGEGASASDSYAINITGEQLVFNEKNYVSQEEIPNIISQASQQGEARTLRRLRMSQTSRQRIGMR
jgi:SLT domain-containing protein